MLELNPFFTYILIFCTSHLGLLQFEMSDGQVLRCALCSKPFNKGKFVVYSGCCIRELRGVAISITYLHWHRVDVEKTWILLSISQWSDAQCQRKIVHGLCKRKGEM
jgi:hypothetical protein